MNMANNRIKELRRARGLTLEEVAEALSTSKQTISRYENGVIANIPHDKVVKIAELLGVTPAVLMGWSDAVPSYNNIMPITKKKLPIIGNIACGEPIYAEEEHESFVAADSNIDATFCLRAQGDSMIGARIHDGDIVFIREQSMVDNGDIAAVVINDEATLKRVYYYPEDGKLILTPENPRYAPLVYIKHELETIKILGKAVAFQSIL